MAQLRQQIRERELASGGDDAKPGYIADMLLNDALERYGFDTNLLFSASERELRTYLRVSTHRGIIGKPLVFVKRRLLMPVFRWLIDYSVDNFRRQQEINEFQLACLRILVLENARLRRDLESHRPDNG